jgi:hypothetical protein
MEHLCHNQNYPRKGSPALTNRGSFIGEMLYVS